MIQGTCQTNLDGYSREEWPKEFVSVPLVGHRVESKTGKILKVCGVTHVMRMVYVNAHDKVSKPRVLIELNR